MKYAVIPTLILVLLKFPSLAQQPENKYDHFLDSLSVSVAALNEQADISVSDISIKELVRILGNSVEKLSDRDLVLLTNKN